MISNVRGKGVPALWESGIYHHTESNQRRSVLQGNI